MKVIQTESKEKGFDPITVQITFESLDEIKNLYIRTNLEAEYIKKIDSVMESEWVNDSDNNLFFFLEDYLESKNII